uniref:Uncharacterized protein n=1 Tax=Fagus sylvatica TaxID=28930 RepID=A0A2N9J6G7_FAGSY
MDALVADHIQYRNDAVHWVLNMTRPAQGWELKSLSSFLDLLYSSPTKGHGMDRVCWQGSNKKGFQVNSYYKAFLLRVGMTVPWKSPGMWSFGMRFLIAYSGVFGGRGMLGVLRGKNS